MSYTWFKLHHEIPDDIKLRRFTPQEKWAWIVLLCLASKGTTRGIIDADNEDISEYCEFNTTQDWLYYRDKLIKKGMLELNADGNLHILHWEDRQYEKPSDRPEATRDRKRKQREREKNSDTSRDVTRDSRASHDTSRTDKTRLDEIRSESEEIRSEEIKTEQVCLEMNNQVLTIHLENEWDGKKKYSALDLEPFRVAFNEYKPSMWKICSSLNKERVKKLNERVIAEFGDRSLEIWIEALQNANHNWAKDYGWTITTFLSSGKNRDKNWVLDFYEAKPVNPAQKQAESYSRMPKAMQAMFAKELQELQAKGVKFSGNNHA
jgi:hypothetical protein